MRYQLFNDPMVKVLAPIFDKSDNGDVKAETETINEVLSALAPLIQVARNVFCSQIEANSDFISLF